MDADFIKVTINGKDFEVPKGARLIDVCREKGFDIPSFCYYSDLALQASCRMCLVRIEKMPFYFFFNETPITEKKNYYAERYLSPMVANDPQRCILCKRCTRVCDEW